VTSPASGPAAGPPLDTDDLAYWKGLARDARRSELLNLRDLSGKWLASLTTVTGVLGVVGVTVNPGALAHRSGPVRLWGLLLLAGVVLAAVVAVLYALRAAQGHPRTISDAPERFRDAWAQSVLALTRSLRASQRAAALALALLLAYAALVTLSRDLAPAYVRVLTGTQVLCGQLRFGPDGTGTLVTAGGQRLRPPIVTLEAVDSC
jgi:hypothetical protein